MSLAVDFRLVPMWTSPGKCSFVTLSHTRTADLSDVGDWVVTVPMCMAGNYGQMLVVRWDFDQLDASVGCPGGGRMCGG